MRVALVTTFAANRKDQLAGVMDRVYQALVNAKLGTPLIRFNFGDPLLPGSTSSVDRVLKRYPDLERFVTAAEPMPGIRGARRISNGPMSSAAGGSVPYETLHAIAAGVPRSFPFHSVVLHFFVEAFGSTASLSARMPQMLPGILLSDSWWVNGRNRELTACTIVDAEPTAKKLPPVPETLASVFAACGKVRRTMQAPLPDADAAAEAVPVRLPGGALAVSANPAAARAVKTVVESYRARMTEIVERARMPHELPLATKTVNDQQGVTAGPRKPALDRVFAPLGYSVKGEAGAFTLRRRTASNLTVELALDVGTWSHVIVGIFRVLGVGFKASLMVPVARSAIPGAQYPIGGAEQWMKVVENLGALVRELDRTFVPDVERAAGPSPEWYQPDSR